LYGDFRRGFDQGDRARGIIFPIAAHCKIEDYVSVSMGDQEAIDGAFCYAIEVWDCALPEEVGFQA
jgi:hypothetical protein